MRASNGCIDPCSASIDSAAATSAARASRSAPASASAATAVDTCVPLISARPSFGAERHGCEAGRARARRAAGVRCVSVPHLAFADQHERDVRERRQIAARADRSAAGHVRVHAAVERRDERLERLDANAGESLRQHIRAQRHRRAHGAHRQRLVDAGRVAAQQVDLQLRQIVAIDPRFGKRAEAGVDAVDRRVAVGARDRRRRAPRSRAPARPARARPRRRRPRSATSDRA